MALDSVHNKEAYFISERKRNKKDAGLGLWSGLNFYSVSFIVFISF
jgi:hypothetical protein